MEERLQLKGTGEIGEAIPYQRFKVAKHLWHRLRRDKVSLVALVMLLLIIAISVAAPVVSPYDPTKGNIRERLKPPAWMEGGSPDHLLGTDQQGRDVLSRLIWGGRVSLTIGFVVVALAGAVGTFLGLISGYFGGWVDMLIMRLVDIQFSFPGLLVALTFVMVLGPGERNLIIALAFNGWMVHARMARGLVLSARETLMVEAARAIGATSSRIIFRHILPNIVSPLITLYVLEIARIIIAEATMSFLGYGIQPPKASWGLMIGEGRIYITNAGWLVTLPGIAIGLTVLCLNLVANWIRSESDPLQKGQRKT